MSRRTFVIGFRLFFAALSLIGVITQLVVTLQKDYSVLNFFSYFTNLSNLFASAVFIVSAIWLALDRPPTQLGVALRGSSVVYIAFVGIVFNTLLHRHRSRGPQALGQRDRPHADADRRASSTGSSGRPG